MIRFSVICERKTQLPALNQSVKVSHCLEWFKEFAKDRSIDWKCECVCVSLCVFDRIAVMHLNWNKYLRWFDVIQRDWCTETVRKCWTSGWIVHYADWFVSYMGFVRFFLFSDSLASHVCAFRTNSSLISIARWWHNATPSSRFKQSWTYRCKKNGCIDSPQRCKYQKQSW